MKKFWLSLTVLIMLSACKSVTFNDLNVQMPNVNLLPPLNTEVDRESVRDSFDVQYSGSSSRSGYTDASGWGGSIDSVNIVRKRDRRMRDMITLFDRNAANVSQAYGERKGTIKLRVTNSSVYNSGLYYAVPSILSLHTLNLLGMPYLYANTDLETEVSIYDRSGDLVWKTTVVGHGEEVVAMYYGYNEEEAHVMSSIRAMKDALAKVNMNIANDFQMIKKGLQ